MKQIFKNSILTIFLFISLFMIGGRLVNAGVDITYYWGSKTNTTKGNKIKSEENGNVLSLTAVINNKSERQTVYDGFVNEGYEFECWYDNIQALKHV